MPQASKGMTVQLYRESRKYLKFNFVTLVEGSVILSRMQFFMLTVKCLLIVFNGVNDKSATVTAIVKFSGNKG